jgi:hypothetical protein
MTNTATPAADLARPDAWPEPMATLVARNPLLGAWLAGTDAPEPTGPSARNVSAYGEPVATRVEKIPGNRAARPYSVQVKLLAQLTGPGSSPIWHGSYRTRPEAVAVAEQLGTRVTRWCDAHAV